MTDASKSDFPLLERLARKTGADPCPCVYLPPSDVVPGLLKGHTHPALRRSRWTPLHPSSSIISGRYGSCHLDSTSDLFLSDIGSDNGQVLHMRQALRQEHPLTPLQPFSRLFKRFHAEIFLA